jgi:hypothetical protein
MRTFKRCTLCVLLASMFVGNGTPLASAQTKHRAIHSGITKGSGTLLTIGPVKYECSMGQCTCVNPKDCGVMGADHVCKEGTFASQGGGGGACTEKAY